MKLADAAHDSIFIINRDLRFEYCNEHGARQLNRRPEDIIGKAQNTLFPPPVVEKHEKNIRGVLDSGIPFYGEEQLIIKQRPTWLGTWLVPMKDKEGAIRAVMGISRDMTALKESETKLDALQKEYQTILDSVPAMVWYKDTKNNILHVNKAAAASVGKSKEELEGAVCHELFPHEAEKYHRDDLEVINSGNPKLGIVEEMQLASGKKIWVQTDKIPYRDGEEKIIGVVAFVLDISERMRAEKMLKFDSEIFRNLAEGIYLIGAEDGIIKYANARFETMFGYAVGELAGKDVATLNAPTTRDPHATKWEIIDSLKQNGEWHGEIENIKKDGTRFWCHANVSLLDHHEFGQVFVSVHADITERKRMETHLRESLKMEAIGRLAGGIAHEFNNVLTGIMGSSHMIKKDLADAHPSQADADEIIALSKRAAGVVSQLLAFGQQWQSPKARLDLNEVVEQNKEKLADTLGASTRLDIELAPGLPSVLANTGNLEHVLHQLCLNSRDAMQGAGRLSIRTRALEIHPPQAPGDYLLPPGPYVLLELADSGPGISPDDLPHIFEPFFTTKSPNASKGMGLSIAHSIMKEHGGAITVQCGPGTTFRLFLPARAKQAPPDAAEDKAPKTRSAQRTILVADDEEAIRKLLVRILQPHDYTLLVAKDGEEALALFRANQDKIALTLLDVMMPKVDGIRAREGILALTPAAKVVLMSGYATAISEKAVRDDYGAFIAKPFTPEELLGKIRELLDA